MAHIRVASGLWCAAGLLSACGSLLLLAFLVFGDVTGPASIASVRGVERITGMDLPDDATLVEGAYRYGWQAELRAVVQMRRSGLGSLLEPDTGGGSETTAHRVIRNRDNFPGAAALAAWRPDGRPVVMAMRRTLTSPAAGLMIQASPEGEDEVVLYVLWFAV